MNIYISKITGGQVVLELPDGYPYGRLFLTKTDTKYQLLFNSTFPEYTNVVTWNITTDITGLALQENAMPTIIVGGNPYPLDTSTVETLYLYETTQSSEEKVRIDITVKSFDGNTDIFVVSPYKTVEITQLIDNGNNSYTLRTDSSDGSTIRTDFTPPIITGKRFVGLSYNSGSITATFLQIGATQNIRIDTNKTFYLAYEDVSTTYTYRVYDYAGNNIKAQIGTNSLIGTARLTVDGTNKILELIDSQDYFRSYTLSWSSDRLEYNFKGLSLAPNSSVVIPINEIVSINQDWFTFYEVWELKSEYTVNVKTTNGNAVLASKNNVKGTTKISLSIENNFRTLKLYDKDNNITTLQWDIINQDKTFIGLALSSNSKTPFIYVNSTKDVDFTNVTFYEVYEEGDTPQPTDEFKLILYKNSAEPKRVDKTDFLKYVGELVGTIRNPTSILSIDLDIEYNIIPNFNYVYIPMFNRYYYVNNITTLSKNLWNIELDVDLLMSYKDGIKSLNAFIDRNENIYNDNIIDKKRVIEQGYDVDIISLENQLFIEDPCYLVNVFNGSDKEVQ